MEAQRDPDTAHHHPLPADPKVTLVTGIPCNLCGSTDHTEVRSRDRDGKPLRSVMCQSCGLVWVDPRPTPEEEREFYRLNYRRDYKHVERPKIKHVYRSGRAALDRWQRLRPWVREGGELLDIGAGGGEFLYVARAAGMKVRGIEPNEGYAAHAREQLDLPVQTGFYQDANVEPRNLDVVTAFHVVEHLEDPFGMMRRCLEWLRADGVLLIEVPNVEARCQHPNRQFHRGHLYHFNRQNLTAMMRRAGFEIVDTFVSADGGNIAATGRKALPALLEPLLPDGNAGRVADILKRHTTASYLLSPSPYLRPMRKLSKGIGEARATRGGADAAAILKRLTGG